MIFWQNAVLTPGLLRGQNPEPYPQFGPRRSGASVEDLERHAAWSLWAALRTPNISFVLLTRYAAYRRAATCEG